MRGGEDVQSSVPKSVWARYG